MSEYFKVFLRVSLSLTELKPVQQNRVKPRVEQQNPDPDPEPRHLPELLLLLFVWICGENRENHLRRKDSLVLMFNCIGSGLINGTEAWRVKVKG